MFLQYYTRSLSFLLVLLRNRKSCNIAVRVEKIWRKSQITMVKNSSWKLIFLQNVFNGPKQSSRAAQKLWRAFRRPWGPQITKKSWYFQSNPCFRLVFHGSSCQNSIPSSRHAYRRQSAPLGFLVERHNHASIKAGFGYMRHHESIGSLI